jgi:choline dehydrogenase-like flavoprotein
MGSFSESYDFIVVGAGPAGCLAASRLARTSQRPSVLLIEAGGKNDSKSVRVDAERWLTRMNPAQNWGYQTVPQKNLDGNVIAYDRGKGLGGSSSINFSCFTVGSSGDYDQIARMVGDDEWKWSNAQGRYKRMECFYSSPQEVPAGAERYLAPRPEDHGHTGPIKVGFPAVWEKSLHTEFDAFVKVGVPVNLDHNSGDPIGLSVCASTAHRGLRSTAADALSDAPENLQIFTDTEVARVTFEGKKATGVETLAGSRILANREVILSAGSLDTVRILMHSGIGPKDQLEKYGIPVRLANPHVGQHLKDHHHITLSYARAEHTTDRPSYYKNKEIQAAARAQWELDQTGPLAEIATSLGIGFLKSDKALQSSEFQALPEHTRKHLKDPTVPQWEFILNGPSAEYFIDPENAPAMTTVFGFLLSEQSSGTVTLQSSDPKTPLLFDPKFLSHPFDRRLAIDLTRELLSKINHTAYAKDTLATVTAPKSESDEDILDFWKQTTGSTWHMTGTARMGKTAEDAVVDNNFKVFGAESLRVADMSIYPILPT